MTENYNVATLDGDGIGLELMNEAKKVISAVEEKYGHKFNLISAPFGAQAVFDYGTGFPEETKKIVMDTDTTLKGPVGLAVNRMKELKARGIKLENETVLAIRSLLDTYCNLRPLFLPYAYAYFSPLKKERIGKGIDMLMVRELVGGDYFGNKVEAEETNGKYAIDEGRYDREQVSRIAHAAFKEAVKRGEGLTNVSKPNVMATGRFWNKVVEEVAKEYSDVPFRNYIVDNMAYQLMIDPSQFNGVILLNNREGDIITDEGGGVLGSLGLMPSACVNPETGKAFYEPAHGSAPDIQGQGIANPYSMIGCVAFMLDKSFGLEEESKDVWNALTNVFAQGYMTRELHKNLDDWQKEQRVNSHVEEFLSVYQRFNPDITKEGLKEAVKDHFKEKDKKLEARIISTSEFGDLVAQNIKKAA